MATYIDPSRYSEELINEIQGTGLLPSNSPYKLLVDAVVSNMSELDQSFVSNSTDAFLASTREELFRHLSDKDEPYLFSTPANSVFTISVPLNDVLNNGIKGTDGRSWSITIPKYSSVLIDEVHFSLMYNVTLDVVERSDYVPYVSYDIYEDTILNKKGTGEVILFTDTNNVRWISFKVELLQVKIEKYEVLPSIGDKVSVDFDVEDTYFSSDLLTLKDGVYIKMNKHYVSNTFDVNSPTVYINIGDNTVRYELPQIFVDNGYSGNMLVTMLSTKGKIIMDMSKYAQEDFKFILGSTSNQLEASSRDVNILVSNVSIINGGTLPTKFNNMKSRIINRATSRMETPITQKQLDETARREGLIGEITSDTLFNRTYVVKKDIFLPDDNNAFPTAFINKINIDFYYDLQETISISESYIEIKSGTLFRQNGEVVKPLTLSEVTSLNNKSPKELINYLSDNTDRIFQTTYTTLISIKDEDVSTLVIDEDSPNLKEFIIVNSNKSITVKGSIDLFKVSKAGNVVTLDFKVNGNISYSDIMYDTYIQMKLPTVDGFISLTAQFNPTTELYSIQVNNSGFISGGNIFISNGIATGVSRELPIVREDVEILLYSLNEDLFNNSGVSGLGYLVSGEIVNNIDTTKAVGIARNNGNLFFAESLDFLWNKTSVTRFKDDYVRHTVDIPKLYEEDVYEIDPRTGSTYFINDTNNDGICDSLTRNKLHSIGDNFLDSSNAIVYKYRVGDLVLGLDGKPINSDRVNYTISSDLLMTEYQYLATNVKALVKHTNDISSIIKEASNVITKGINDRTLDNTQVLFKPKNSVSRVETTDGVLYDSHIVPKVTLYFDKDITSSSIDKQNLNIVIGNIIRQYIIKKRFELDDIERAISKKLNNTKVNIEEFTSDNSRVFSLKPINYFNLGVDLRVSGELLYNIELSIRYI